MDVKYVGLPLQDLVDETRRAVDVFFLGGHRKFKIWLDMIRGEVFLDFDSGEIEAAKVEIRLGDETVASFEKVRDHYCRWSIPASVVVQNLLKGADSLRIEVKRKDDSI